MIKSPCRSGSVCGGTSCSDPLPQTCTRPWRGVHTVGLALGNPEGVRLILLPGEAAELGEGESVDTGHHPPLPDTDTLARADQPRLRRRCPVHVCWLPHTPPRHATPHLSRCPALPAMPRHAATPTEASMPRHEPFSSHSTRRCTALASPLPRARSPTVPRHGAPPRHSGPDRPTWRCISSWLLLSRPFEQLPVFCCVHRRPPGTYEARQE